MNLISAEQKLGNIDEMMTSLKFCLKENRDFISEFDKQVTEEKSADADNIYQTDSFFNQKKEDYKNIKKDLSRPVRRSISRKINSDLKPTIRQDEISYEDKFKMIMQKYKEHKEA